MGPLRHSQPWGNSPSLLYPHDTTRNESCASEDVISVNEMGRFQNGTKGSRVSRVTMVPLEAAL
jgi:hypothetical protein